MKQKLIDLLVLVLLALAARAAKVDGRKPTPRSFLSAAGGEGATSHNFVFVAAKCLAIVGAGIAACLLLRWLELRASSPVLAEADSQTEKVDENDPTVTFSSLQAAEQDLEQWKRCSGLHTVEKWCSEYHKHPGGWGALLMIHGIPEVTNRLRRKVDNYAIYAALFLSGSMALIITRPTRVVDCGDGLECQVLRHLYCYSVAAGMIAHVLCILLAIAFTNALNEAARDSDVIRMFARGEGFYATAKCERCFYVGVVACILANVVVLYTYIGLDIVVFVSVGVFLSAQVYYTTSGKLFRNASIISYWRFGSPDAGDEYDLTEPVKCLQQRAQLSRSAEAARHSQALSEGRDTRLPSMLAAKQPAADSPADPSVVPRLFH